jgi:phthiodiolone/phenolphthiodiolone dimycocerosates ketoreductase
MTYPRIDVGMYIPAKPPLAGVEQLVSAARQTPFDSVFMWDHILDFFPQAIWDEEFSWLASFSTSPHEWFDFQTLLGYLAGKAPEVRLGVGVAEPIRRHPIILAQAMLTLSHLSSRPPILGIGSGERMNTEPYGLEFSHSVSKLEEALQIIRLAFTSQGPITFQGRYFQLDNAVLDLQPAAGNTPEIWVSAHGPRMLQLTGQYGDGWYPFAVASPEDYAARLAVIRTAATEAGRDPDAITPAFHCITIVAPTEEEARMMLNTKAVRFLGLIFPGEIWQLFGREHPLGGRGFRGYLDILPQAYDRTTLDDAIDQVPPAMIESLLWGTPEQIVNKLRAFGEAGLRHVVPMVASAAVSEEAAQFSVQALGEIAQALQSGE